MVLRQSEHIDELLNGCAALVGRPLPEQAGPDSFNVLPALLGESSKGRDHVVEHSGVLAIREGPWKLVPEQGAAKRAPKAKSARAEVYNLSEDLGETMSLADSEPAKTQAMSKRLQNIRQNDRSR